MPDRSERLHPLVERFATTGEPLLEILRDAHASDLPMVRAMGLLRDAIGQAHAGPDALETARSIPLDHPDPGLTAMFLAIWGSCTARAPNLTELEGIVKRLRAMDLRSQPPEIRIIPHLLSGILARVKGDIAVMERQLRAVTDMVPIGSPRRISFAIELMHLLAPLGRLTELEADIAALRDDDSLHVRWILPAVRLTQYAETGRAPEAEEQLRRLAEAPWQMLTFFEKEIARARALSALVGERWAAGSPAPAALRTTGWPAVVDHLLARRPAAALELARRQASADADLALYDPTFRGFNLIRAELSNRNGEAASRLVHLRRERGVRHPLDPLFLARAARLRGQPDEATRLFGRARANADRYRAHGRFDLELRAACELTPSDLLELAGAPTPRPRVQPLGDAGGSGRPRRAFQTLVGDSAPMQEVRAAIARFGRLDTPVLITGETGTGKELVARALHEASARSAEPFLAVNCGGIAEGLLESELFGHARGAFTGANRARKGLFEAAGAGTLFLDEIGEVSPRLQVVLLRVLETGELRPVGSNRTRQAACRVLAATNAELDARVAAGSFRADLLYRLRQLEIPLPPLRERRSDCAVLARHFLAEGRADGVPPLLDAGLVQALEQERWPGNVRELRNVVERMRVLNSDAARYDATALERARTPTGGGSAPLGDGGDPVTGTETAPTPADGSARRVLRRGRSAWRRRERLAELFRQHRRLSRSEVMQLLAVSHGTAQRDLEALATEGLVTRITPTASTRTYYYELLDRSAATSFSPPQP